MPYCSAILASMKPIETYHLNHCDMDALSQASKKTIDDVIEELHMIKSKTGEKGLDDFVRNICNIGGRPTVDGRDMLIYLSQQWDRKERRDALKYYHDTDELEKLLMDDGD